MDKEIWLERALKNELSEEEVLLFEQMLKEDSDLRGQYDFERKVKEGLEQKERQKLKTFFQKEEQRKVIPLWIGWAAAAVLVFGFGWFLWPAQTSEGRLYLSYYQKFPNVVSPVTRGSDSEENAYTLYEKGSYDEALKALKSMPGDTAHFYKSLCLLELDRGKEALQSFNDHSYDSALDDYRQWYLSLLYLKNEESQKAVPILENLAQKGFDLREKAEELLLKIK